jgi:hypothetical protein
MKGPLLFLIVVNFGIAASFNFLRFKRDGGDLFGQLSQVIQQIAAPLAGPPKPTQNDPSFNAGPGSGVNNGPPRSQANGPHPPQKSLGDVVGYCNQSPQACSYLACMGSNFKNNDNLKAGSKVLADPDLRSAIANDPAILKEACSKAGLNDNGCANFKMILGFADKVDPKSLHTNDEPRNKRSPFDDYGGGHSGGSPKSSSSSGAGASSSNSQTNSGAAKSSSGSSSGSNSAPAKHSGSDYDYDHGHGGQSKSSSQGTGQGSNGQGGSQGSNGQQGGGNKQQDCEAMMFKGNNGNNGNSNINSNNNNNNNNSNNFKSRVKARKG